MRRIVISPTFAHGFQKLESVGILFFVLPSVITIKKNNKIMKAKFEVTMAAAVTQGQSARGELYSMQEVTLKMIEMAEGEKPFYVVVKLFNKPALKLGDKIDAELRFDVRQYGGKNYNQIDVTEMTIMQEPTAF